MEQVTTAPPRTMSGFIACKAAQHMSREIISVLPTTTLAELQDLFDKFDFNAFPVMENGKLVGIVTKFDALRSFAFTPDHMMPLYHQLMRLPVSSFMTKRIVSVSSDTPLTRVLQTMIDARLRSVLVIDAEKQLVGIISREDVLRALRETVGQER